MVTYLFATSSDHLYIIGVRKDLEECRQKAQLVIQLKADIQLGEGKEIVDAAAIGWDVPIVNKRSQDETLTQILNDHFGNRAKIEIQNEPHTDGTVTKGFWIGSERAVELLLDTRDYVAEYESRGLRV